MDHSEGGRSVSAARKNDYASALGHFIACAVVQTGDTDAWANAMIAAFRTQDGVMVPVLLHAAICLAGLSAYDALRERLAAQNAGEALLAALDAAALAADERRDSSQTSGFTFRLLGEDRPTLVGRIADDEQ